MSTCTWHLLHTLRSWPVHGKYTTLYKNNHYQIKWLMRLVFIAIPWISLRYVVLSQLHEILVAKGWHVATKIIVLKLNFWSLQQGGVFTTKKICVACRVSYCIAVWIGCYCWRCHNKIKKNVAITILYCCNRFFVMATQKLVVANEA